MPAKVEENCCQSAVGNISRGADYGEHMKLGGYEALSSNAGREVPQFYGRNDIDLINRLIQRRAHA